MQIARTGKSQKKKKKEAKQKKTKTGINQKVLANLVKHFNSLEFSFFFFFSSISIWCFNIS